MSALAASICITVLQKKHGPSLRVVPALRLAGTKGVLCAQRPHAELRQENCIPSFSPGTKSAQNTDSLADSPLQQDPTPIFRGLYNIRKGRCGKITGQPTSAQQEALQSTEIGNAKHSVGLKLLIFPQYWRARSKAAGNHLNLLALQNQWISSPQKHLQNFVTGSRGLRVCKRQITGGEPTVQGMRDQESTPS